MKIRLPTTCTLNTHAILGSACEVMKRRTAGVASNSKDGKTHFHQT